MSTFKQGRLPFAIGFYILEGALLAVSRTEAFSLLRISQEYATAANPALQMMGQGAYESMDYVGNTLHMLAFYLGAILFYTLIHKIDTTVKNIYALRMVKDILSSDFEGRFFLSIDLQDNLNDEGIGYVEECLIERLGS